MTKIKINEENLGDFKYWDLLFKTEEKNFYKLKKQTKQDLLEEAYSKAPDEVRLNKEWVMKCVYNHCFNFYIVDKKLKNREVCIEYVEKHKYPYVYQIPAEFQSELFEKIIIKTTFSIRDLFYEKNLRHLHTRENIIKWMNENPKLYEELVNFEKYIKDIELAEIAAKIDNSLLLVMPKSMARKIIEKNLDLALKYIEKDIRIFPLLPLKVRNDKNFILKHLYAINYNNTSFIGSKALKEKEVILKIKSFDNLKIDESLCKDKEVAYHIIKTDLYVQKYIKDCDNFTLVDLIKNILEESKSTIFYNRLSECYKKEPKILLTLLNFNTFKEKKESSVETYMYKYYNIEDDYKESSVIKLLPKEIINELKQEFKEKKERENTTEEELLIFAKGKYLEIILNEQMPSKYKLKKMKI